MVIELFGGEHQRFSKLRFERYLMGESLSSGYNDGLYYFR